MSKPPGGAKRPATASQRASESRARRKEREGWRRGEIIIKPDLDAALQRLIAKGYAPDQQACFRRAVFDASTETAP